MSVSVTIRDVPDDVRDILAARAARAGRSLQEHLKAELVRMARRPSMNEVLDGVAKRKAATKTRLSGERILKHRDAERR